MNYVLYSAFGKQTYVHEAICSILSLLNTVDSSQVDLKVVVLTNNINPFEVIFKDSERVILEYISDSMLEDWIAGTGYMPRVKIKSIQYFFQKYHENVIFIDSDTIIYKNINMLFERINQNKVIMYSKCASIEDSLEVYKRRTTCPDGHIKPRAALYTDIYENNYISDLIDNLKIAPSFCPYNSGVIGLSTKYEHILEEVLQISEVIYKKYKYFCAEEFAFSYVMQNYQEISECWDFIYHYYFFKPCRYIASVILGYSNGCDKNELNSLLKKLSIKDLNISKLRIEDLPYFVLFCLPIKNRIAIRFGFKLKNVYFSPESFMYIPSFSEITSYMHKFTKACK